MSPHGRVRTWLIAYDIRDIKRLRSVHRYLSRNAHALQYSLFVTDTDQAGLIAIQSELERRAKAGVDDIRIYALRPETYGAWAGLLPESDDVWIFGSTAARLARHWRDNPWSALKPPTKTAQNKNEM